MWPGWPGKFGQRGWWIFCLAPTPPWQVSSEHNKAPAVDERSGFQVECGVGHDQKCKEEGRVDGATRRAFAIGRLVLATSMPQTGIDALYRRSSPSNWRPVTRSTRHCHAGGRRPGRTTSRRGHHLHPDGTRRCLSRGGGGLAQPAGSGLAVVDPAGCRSLARIGGRGRRLARAISGRLQFPPPPFGAGGVDAGASPLRPYVAARSSKEIRSVPQARFNEVKHPLRGRRDVKMTRRSTCKVSTHQNQNAAAKDLAVPRAFNSAAMEDHITPGQGLPGSSRDRRFPT